MTPIVYGPQFDRLRSAHVVLSARARRHEVSGFPGPLSVKSVVRGEALWRVGGKAFTVDATSCLIVDRDEPYDMRIDALQPVETFVVFFADGFVADVATTRFSKLERLLERGGEPDRVPMPVTRRLWEGATALAAAMRSLRRADQAAPGAADRGLRTILDACADLSAEARAEAERIDAAKPATRAELHRRVVRGKGLIDETIAQPFDLAAAAGEACMAEHHFHRTFAAAFGEAPYAYVVRRRIERAKRLLAEEDLPVAEVCAAVGYESLPSFTRRFRHSTGRSPAAFREQFRKDG